MKVIKFFLKIATTVAAAFFFAVIAAIAVIIFSAVFNDIDIEYYP